MIKTIIRAMYSAFIFIVLLSIILTGWTCFAFISQPTKSDEIINVMKDMYKSQKSVIIDVVDLSKLLIMDKSKIIAREDNNLLIETEIELLTDEEDKSSLDDPLILEDKSPLDDPLILEDKSPLDNPLILEDNGDNPLGIVIEPSLPELSEENYPEISVGTLDNNESEVSMNEMKIGMDMN